MRKDNSPYEEGDIIEIYEDLPDGETPDVGRRPHMDDEYGSMHSVIHVIGMTKAEAEKYKDREIVRDDQTDCKVTIKNRVWKVDVQNKVTALHKAKMRGAKSKAFEDRYDAVAKKPKKNAFDAEMTKVEFESFMLQRPPEANPQEFPEFVKERDIWRRNKAILEAEKAERVANGGSD